MDWDKDADDSCIALSPETMDELGLFRGDTVKVISSTRSTILVALSNPLCGQQSVMVGPGCMTSLSIAVGSSVRLCSASDVVYGKLLVLSIEPGSVAKGKEDDEVREHYINPFFTEAYRPVSIGDSFTIPGPWGPLQFSVSTTEPEENVIVCPETEIQLQRGGLLHEMAP